MRNKRLENKKAMVLKLLDKNVNGNCLKIPKTYFGSDIQKSLGSLLGFPWAKYPGEKHLLGHNYTGPDDKIKKQKIDLKQLIDNIKPDISEEKLTELETKLNDNSEIDAIKHQLLNVVDKTQLQNVKSLISNLNDKVTKLKINLKQLIDNIKPGISEEKLTELETKLNDNSEIDAIKQQLLNVVDKTQLQSLSSLISNLNDKIKKQKIDLKQLIDNIKPGISEDKWQQQSTALETKFKTELQKEVTNINQLIQNIYDSEIQQQITTINNEVLKQGKNIAALEKHIKENKQSYYFNLPCEKY
ncbi:hypothetical protein LOTGIDRAFT_162376 [Lottia gigantea]|uniref:Uncharacterized protein n=1 Tax=Lottia gigantea TaxID=225164 RepID=V4A860_LOTGI|nr:hypothetical protein LOTGIDRAFT_162376 [Lottia gigantea]ESO92897.1 hypothetical protein LOTGIDRAFT_162376 [Lottia gigantea]